MKRLVFLAILIAHCAFHTFAQTELRKKDVKRALEGGNIQSIELVSPDQFKPETKQEFDLKVILPGGASFMASDFHFVWDEVALDVTNSQSKIKSDFLADGKGLIRPGERAMYYPSLPITIHASLLGKESSKELRPDFCASDYRLVNSASNGSNGSRGSNGYSAGASGQRGSDGQRGKDAADIHVVVEEEVVGDKTFFILTVNGVKYPFDASCSTVVFSGKGGDGGRGGEGGDGGDGRKEQNKFTSAGGRGANGGDGGDGGNGGNLYVSGAAYEKYKDKISFVSRGGNGGQGGRGGRGGNGTSSGSSGSYGSSGRDGSPGKVIVNTD